MPGGGSGPGTKGSGPRTKKGPGPGAAALPSCPALGRFKRQPVCPVPSRQQAGLGSDWRREQAARSYWLERGGLGRGEEGEGVIRRREVAAILCGRQEGQRPELVERFGLCFAGGGVSESDGGEAAGSVPKGPCVFVCAFGRTRRTEVGKGGAVREGPGAVAAMLCSLGCSIVGEVGTGIPGSMGDRGL